MLENVDRNVDEIDSNFLKVFGLTVIPVNFLELEVLNLSNTNIVSLPSSISSLSSLQAFFLRDCSALVELPTQIGMLTKLKLFDIKGTEIMCLPKEMRYLKNLEVLRVSLSQYADYYIKTTYLNENVIPRKMLSELKNLKELCICVCPKAEWWEKEVNDIQNELCYLEKLETLQWYLPTDKVLHEFLLLERNHSPIYANMSNLMLTIGQHAQLTSCLPRDFEKKFEQFNNCLKWINAEGNMDDISKIIARVETLFLSRHWTVKKLSTFNIKKLKYCLLAECNKMETLVEVDELSEDVGTRIDGEKVELRLLEYLSIHYMKELKSICKGPIGKGNLSKLTILALHTCPELTTIFTRGVAQNLSCLIEITVEDCPKVTSLISNEFPDVEYGPLFPSLERIFLLDLPELVCIFGGQIILEKLDSLLIYSCRKLCYLSIIELPHIQKIKGEVEWWKDLEYDKSKWESVFEPLKERGDLVEQLSEATNSLKHFHDIVLSEAKDEEPLDGCGSGAHTSNFPFGEELKPGPAQISLEAIKLATNNFSDENNIVRGGFGRVYRGQLFYKGERIMVAVTRLDQGFEHKEFPKEMIKLPGSKDANHVSLLGFCDERDEDIFVYKYGNKSLDVYLSSIALTWTQRLKICIEVARELDYLHRARGVIHRDIKSSNVLLDDNWNAKLSDFGLVKFSPANQASSYLISNVAGTKGYLDPLYLSTGILSKESDIYSFGVLLLEVLCGRRSVWNDGVQVLPGLVKTYYKENKLDAIIYDGLRDQILAESLEKYSAIAYLCLSEDRRKRPPAAKIVAELEIALQCQMVTTNRSTNSIHPPDQRTFRF